MAHLATDPAPSQRKEAPVMPDNDAIISLAVAVNVYQGICAGAAIMAVCAALAAVVRYL